MSAEDRITNGSSKTKSSSQTASSKTKLTRRPTAEAASGWSNDIDEDDGTENKDAANILASQLPIMRQTNRRAAEEIQANDIPTIPTDDAEPDDSVDLNQQIAIAPAFSVYQITSFKDIEHEYSHQRTNQYISSDVDIGILYNNLHLQEQFDIEDQKLWDWDKLFVEVRSSITNPTLIY